MPNPNDKSKLLKVLLACLLAPPSKAAKVLIEAKKSGMDLKALRNAVKNLATASYQRPVKKESTKKKTNKIKQL